MDTNHRVPTIVGPMERIRNKSHKRPCLSLGADVNVWDRSACATTLLKVIDESVYVVIRVIFFSL